MMRRTMTYIICAGLALTLGACTPAEDITTGPATRGTATQGATEGQPTAGGAAESPSQGGTGAAQHAKALTWNELDNAMLKEEDSPEGWKVQFEMGPGRYSGPKGSDQCHRYVPNRTFDAKHMRGSSVYKKGTDASRPQITVNAWAFADEGSAKSAYAEAVKPLKECAEVSTSGQPDAMLKVTPAGDPAVGDESTAADLEPSGRTYVLGLRIVRVGTVVYLVVSNRTPDQTVPAAEVSQKQAVKLADVQK